MQAALGMAQQRRNARGVVLHSDQGSQCTAVAFTRQCERAGIQQSMGSAGDCYDNAMAESLFATLECELLRRVPFASREEAGREIFRFLEASCNRRRRHSALGCLSPVDFERSWHAGQAGAAASWGSGLPKSGRAPGRALLQPPCAPVPLNIPNHPRHHGAAFSGAAAFAAHLTVRISIGIPEGARQRDGQLVGHPLHDPGLQAGPQQGGGPGAAG